MRPLHPLAVLALAVPCAEATTHAPPRTVEVFTIQAYPVMNPDGATVYYLDATALLAQRLSAGLPMDPHHAQALARERIAGIGSVAFAQATVSARGLVRATQLGLTRAPAVVFDGRWVVYGVTDVVLAKRLFASAATLNRK
jgi:integrating conjugative element protein (TIGR03757 family)